MSYQDFYHDISETHHVIPRFWPLRKFCSPHQLGLVACRVLYNALAGEKPRQLFQKLEGREWQDFRTAVIRRDASALDECLTAAFNLLFSAAPNAPPDPQADQTPTHLAEPAPSPLNDLPQPDVPIDPILLEPVNINVNVSIPVAPGISPQPGTTTLVPTGKRVRAKRWDAGLTREERTAELKRREERKEEERKRKTTQKEMARREKAEAAKQAGQSRQG